MRVHSKFFWQIMILALSATVQSIKKSYQMLITDWQLDRINFCYFQSFHLFSSISNLQVKWIIQGTGSKIRILTSVRNSMRIIHNQVKLYDLDNFKIESIVTKLDSFCPMAKLDFCLVIHLHKKYNSFYLRRFATVISIMRKNILIY